MLVLAVEELINVNIGWCSAVSWIYGDCRVDDIEIFWVCWEGLTQSQGLLCFLCCHMMRWLRVHGRLGRGTIRTQITVRWPKVTQGILHTMWHHISIWSRGKNEEGGTFGMLALIFPSNIMCDGALVSWPWLNTCLTMGRRELLSINCFAFLLCMFLLSPLTCFYLSPWVSHLLAFPLSPWSHWWGS